MSDTNNNTENSQKPSHGILTSFLIAFLLCSVLYGGAIYLHNGHIVEGQNRIIRTYARQVEKMESEKISMNMRDGQREKEISSFHQEVKSLLDLEFNRIQNEFEAIEIWAGILTVIFLIFSFYSLFKTEQLENLSREELTRMKQISENGKLKLGLFDKESKTALSTLHSSVESIRKELEARIDDVLNRNKADALNDFNQSAKNILVAYKEELSKKMSENQNAIENGYNQYINILKSIAEKDMNMDDEGEDELDEEELRNDFENEANVKED